MSERVIIDCDPGIDDSLAIMMALGLPDLNVCGITITAGNSPVEMGRKNALKILNFLDRLDVPVFAGAPHPLKREFVNALDTHGDDGLGESHLPDTDGYDQKETAQEFFCRILEKEPCSVIAIGPMTNLAILAEERPDLFCRIPRIVSMGGAFRSHGNCSPVAEYNYWCDPHAADTVYRFCGEHGIDLTMVGLDVTRQVVLTPNLLAYLKRQDGKTGSFIEKITKFYMDFHWEWEHLIGCVINDPLAVAYFYDSSVCSGFRAYTQIETEGISLGQSVVDSMNFYRREPNARILTEVDTQAFFSLFFSGILHIRQEELDDAFKYI